jgi:hypothetical protein
MRKPIYIRALTEGEQQTLQEGRRSPNAFVLRRCPILLVSARGQTARVIGEALGCDDQTVRNVLHACNTQGREQLRALLHQSPRTFGHPTSLWTLPLAAAVAYAEGLTARPISGEAIRRALARLGGRWQRAKHWITSPDPAYIRKKNAATG